MSMLAVMPNCDVSFVHDSSLDDLGLLRRCERRIATFPKCEHTFSFSSADTSWSNALLTPPATVFDVGEEIQSDDSFQAPTDKRDSTFYGNTSVNRNPCPDSSRRWAEQRDCSFTTHCKCLQQKSTNAQSYRKLPECIQHESHPQLYCIHECAFSGNQQCAPSTHQKADTCSISSISSPIVDNLILESETNLKHAHCDKTSTQSGKVVRCSENETQTSKSSLTKEASAGDCINKKRIKANKQHSGSRSFQGSKEMLDPSSEIYLKKLDNVLQKMSLKSDRQSLKVSDKVTKTVNTKKAFTNPVNKNRIPSPGRRSCNCPCRFSANGKLNLNGDANEVKFAGHVKSRLGAKQDMFKVENNVPASRNATRTRCARTDKRRNICGCESVGRDQVRLPNFSHEKFISSNKKRSKSLSALPRCQLQEMTSFNVASNRGSVKFNTCAATGSKRQGTFSYDSSGILSKQQLEILKHIPGDITPDETGALLKTVLSIIEQRNCMKSCAHSDVVSRKDPHGGTEWVPGSLSKYQPERLSESSCTFTSLSPQSKLSYFDRYSQALGSEAPVPISCSSETYDQKADKNLKDGHHQTANTLLNSVATMIKEPATSKINLDIVEHEQLNTDHRCRTKFCDIASSHGGFSTERITTTPNQNTTHKTDQLAKKSAIVFPYDDSFTSHNRQSRGESAAQKSYSYQILVPTSNDAAGQSHHTEGHETQLSGTSYSSSSSAASRHIGWRCPQPSRKDSNATAVEVGERGRSGHSSRVNQDALVKFDSALSDDFLYCRSTKFPRSTSHPVVSQKDSLSSTGLPGASREADVSSGLKHHGGKTKSDALRLTGPGIPREHPFLLPCPHGSGHNGQISTCQHDANLDQKPKSHQCELDKVINDLRTQIRNSYGIQNEIKHTAVTSTPIHFNENISRAKFVLSHSRDIRVGGNEIASRVKGQQQSEATHLDNISLSTEAVLTNSSLSNRSLGLDEFPRIHRHLRQGTSFNYAEDISSCFTVPFHNEQQVNNQLISSNSERRGSGNVRPEENMVSQFLNQIGRNENQQKETYVLFHDHQPPICSAVNDAAKNMYPESDKRSLAISSTTSNRISCEVNSLGRDFEGLKEPDWLTGGVSNHHNIGCGCDVINQGRHAENICSQNNILPPESFRNLESLEATWPHESVNCVAKRENMKHINMNSLLTSHSSVEPTDCVDACKNAKSFVNINSYNKVKLPTHERLPGTFGPSSNKEPHMTVKPFSCENSSRTIEQKSGSLHLQSNVELPNNSSPTIILKSPTEDNSLTDIQPRKEMKPPCQFKSAPLNEVVYTTATEQIISPNLITNTRNAELAQLKEKTESLLADVYRKYYTDLLVPNTKCTTVSELTNSLELLQNFSPISQVDVNTQYPLTIDTVQEQTSVKSTDSRQNGADKSQMQISSKETVIKMSDKKRTKSSKNKNISLDNNKMESTVSRPVVLLKNNPRIETTDKNKQTSHKSNTTRNNLHEKTLRKDQSKPSDLTCCDTTDDILLSDTTEPVRDGKGLMVLDVTSLHKSDQCPVKRSENTSGNEEPNIITRDLVVKTYNTGSAVPVNVKVIREINARAVASLDNTTSFNRRSFNKASQRVQTSTTKLRPCEKFRSDKSKWYRKEDENESAKNMRPSAKILGELAFQLERRILDYVFGMEGSRTRRFYGYTVNNICHMMNKECKNWCGNDDLIRKSELAFRLKKLLIGLRKVGYDIKVHGDFAQQMVNTYGLLPCPPDPCTIDEFGLHNADCISNLLSQLATNELEHKNLQILLNSLKYLSKCDGRPLFVW